jgi:hypothetical protein
MDGKLKLKFAKSIKISMGNGKNFSVQFRETAGKITRHILTIVRYLLPFHP